MNKLVFFFFAVLVGVNAFDNPITPVPELFKDNSVPTTAVLDATVELCISKIRQMFVEVPLPLPDITTKQFIGHGGRTTTKLTDGQLFGVDTKYYDDAITEFSLNKTAVLIKLHFGYKKFSVNYKYTAATNKKTSTGTIDAELVGFNYLEYFFIALDTFEVGIEDFKILDEGVIDIKVDGQTNRNIASGIKSNIKETVIGAAKQLLVDLVNDHNSKLNL